MGAVADPKKYTILHMCYLAENGRSALKGVGINRGELQKFGRVGLRPLETGSCLTPKKSNPLCMCVTTSNMVVLRQKMYA